MMSKAMTMYAGTTQHDRFGRVGKTDSIQITSGSKMTEAVTNKLIAISQKVLGAEKTPW